MKLCLGRENDNHYYLLLRCDGVGDGYGDWYGHGYGDGYGYGDSDGYGDGDRRICVWVWRDELFMHPVLDSTRVLLFLVIGDNFYKLKRSQIDLINSLPNR